MGKKVKPKKKEGQKVKDSVKPEESGSGDASAGTWRGGRKPLTVTYPNNAPVSAVAPTVLKRPVQLGFGPAWIHNNNNATGTGREVIASTSTFGKDKLTSGQALIPVPDANSCVEHIFSIKIDNDISLLKSDLHMKDENELPAPMSNFRPAEPRPKGYYSYFSPWNARNYAHKIKSNFQSFHLACNEITSLGNADFISDVENIKRIMQMKSSNQYESFICHRIGNTVLVDKFNLQSLYWKCRNQFWPWFECYARKVIGEDEERIKMQNSYAAIRDMETLHIFFYSCLKEIVQLESVPDSSENGKNKFKRNPFPIPESNEDNFLSRFQFHIDNLSMNLGSSIPVFSKDDSKVTLRTFDGEDLSQSDLTDIYLEQLLLGVNKTYLAYHDDMILTRSEWLLKNCIFNGHGVLKADIIKDGINMMQFLKEKVVKPSHSYWLFKAPGKEHMLVDLTSKMQEDGGGHSTPFGLPFASLLYRYCETFHKVMKTEVALCMLNHAECILMKNDIEKEDSLGFLKSYFAIRRGLREKRPDISDPSDPAANHKPFDYQSEILEDGCPLPVSTTPDSVSS